MPCGAWKNRELRRPLMPKIERKDRERICAYCRSFAFVARRQPGQAYCKKKKRHFPNQVLIEVPENMRSQWVPAGRRTCKDWS